MRDNKNTIRTKNANEKLAILLLQEKDDKVLIVAGNKNMQQVWR